MISGKSVDIIPITPSENSNTDTIGEGLKTSVKGMPNILPSCKPNSNEATGNIVRYIESLLKVSRLFILK